MKSKSRFMTLLQFAFAGLLGILLPAMVLVHFAPLIPGLIIMAVLTASVGGMVIGTESRNAAIAEIREQAEGQRQLLIEKESLIEAQVGTIESLNDRIVTLKEDINKLEAENKQIKEDILADRSNYNKQGWVISKTEGAVEMFFTVINGLFVWTQVPTSAIRFLNKRSADAWLSHYEPRFSFVRDAQTARYPRKEK